ncbi:hypothetical protein FHX10_003186 [Rhizobium sp. BK591]|nr:hypothetical protein [Rhizobium sp. BK591]
MIAVVVRLSGGFSCPNRIAECLKQRTVHGVGLRIVFGMPLHAERKSRRILEPYRLDRPVLCNAFGNDPVAKLENALSMQGVHPDRLPAEDACKHPILYKLNIVTIAENDGEVGMDLAGFQARHSVVHASGQFPDFGMQRAAGRDVHFLETAAYAENRNAARYTGFDQWQRQPVTILVIRFMLGIRHRVETAGMDIGSGACQQNAVDDSQQIGDIGQFGVAGKHQRKLPTRIDGIENSASRWKFEPAEIR